MNEYLNNKMKRGISLVVLVITIILLTILAGVIIVEIKNDNTIEFAKDAIQKHNHSQGNENKLIDELLDRYTGEDDVTVQVILANGTEVTITKQNFGDYLGKKVTNYIGKDKVTIGSSTYTVSTDYRLYYVDFENKYGDGVGTIYLKAECTKNGYVLPTTDTTSADAANIKIKNLNPGLYGITPLKPSGSSEIISPDARNNNMKAATWLTNINNWANLADLEMSDNINYIVGSPSVEMMMDSYNVYYKLTGALLDNSEITPGERTRLFYKYQSNTTGYQVGPNSNSSDGYSIHTSGNSVYTDKNDSMYYPGDGKYYWLASPSSNNASNMMDVCCSVGGIVGSDPFNSTYNFAFCPLVSLKFSTKLKLAN